MTYLPDTSCLVALLCSWHEHHAATLREMSKRKRNSDTLVLAGHSLVETYAVLTRLPHPFRLAEEDAWQLLDRNFAKTQIVALTSRQYWRTIQLCRDEKISGGQIYDGVITSCARKARARVLLTWNREHFLRFQGEDLIVETPG